MISFWLSSVWEGDELDIDGLCSKIQIGIPDDELSGKITSLARDIITCIVDINYELDLIDIIIRDKE